MIKNIRKLNKEKNRNRLYEEYKLSDFNKVIKDNNLILTDNLHVITD